MAATKATPIEIQMAAKVPAKRKVAARHRIDALALGEGPWRELLPSTAAHNSLRRSHPLHIEALQPRIV
jgi:hypothetical protein